MASTGRRLYPSVGSRYSLIMMMLKHVHTYILNYRPIIQYSYLILGNGRCTYYFPYCLISRPQEFATLVGISIGSTLIYKLQMKTNLRKL